MVKTDVILVTISNVIVTVVLLLCFKIWSKLTFVIPMCNSFSYIIYIYIYTYIYIIYIHILYIYIISIYNDFSVISCIKKSARCPLASEQTEEQHNTKRESMKDYKYFFYQYSEFYIFTRQSSVEKKFDGIFN